MWLNRPPIKDGIATIADAPGLGIVLDHIDPGAKLLVFKDKSGVTVSKHYF